MGSISLGPISTLKRAPLLRTVIPFILGLLLAKQLSLPAFQLGMAVLGLLGLWLLLAFLPVRFTYRWVPGTCLALLLCGFGLFWQTVRAGTSHPGHISHLASQGQGWVVEVLEITSHKERSMRMWARVREAMVNGQSRKAHGGLYITLLLDQHRELPRRGDLIAVKAHADAIEQQPNPGGFDLRNWAASHGTYHQCFAPAERWTLMQRGRHESDAFEQVREVLTGWLADAGLPASERGLIRALLLGQRDQMAPDMRMDFVKSGTVHVLAVSGTHVGIIYGALVLAMGRMSSRRWGRLLRGLIALAALWAYAGLTGMAPSVMRATVMFSFFSLALMIGRRTNSINSLAGAAWVLLVIDPLMLGQLSFQLSFLAVLGIVVFYAPLYRLWEPPNRVFEFLWALVVVSLAAQSFTTPLSVFIFGAFPVWFLPANMLIVGLVALVIYGGILLLALHAVPLIGPMVATLMQWLLQLLGTLSGFFATLPGAYPSIRLGFWGMMGLYGLLALAAWWLLLGSMRGRRLTLASLVILLLAWGWTAHQRNEQQDFVVYDDFSDLSVAVVTGRTLHAFTGASSSWADQRFEEHAARAGIRRVRRHTRIPFLLEHEGMSHLCIPVGRTELGNAQSAQPATVVLYGDGWIDPEALGEGNSATRILAPGLTQAQRRMVKEAVQKTNGNVYDIRAQGAYIHSRSPTGIAFNRAQ